MRQKLDLVLNRFLSRKLMVFFVACFGLFSGTLDSADWVIIAGIYIGSQSVIEAIAQLKK